MDLLGHEVGVATAIQLFDIPIDIKYPFLRGRGIKGKGAVTVGSEYGHFAIVEWDDLLGVAHHGTYIGTNQHFVFADTKDHR